MTGAILTQIQAAELLGQFYAPNSYFNPFCDINANLCISEAEIVNCTAIAFQWVKALTIVTITPFVYQSPFGDNSKLFKI